MSNIQDLPSGVTNSVDTEGRKLVDPYESIGTPGDAAATSVSAENSAFALGKGILSGLGMAAGSGTATVNTSPNVYVDPEITLGDVSDAKATNSTGTWSAISLLKGICAQAGL